VRPAARGDAPPPGIVDTLTAGFQAVNRVPWVIGVPVLLDLLLWLGPRLSVASLSERALAALTTVVESSAAAAGPAGAEQMGQFQQQIEVARAITQAFNLLSLLGGLLMHSAVPPEQGGMGGLIEVDTTAALLGLSIGLLLPGVALACIWLGVIAQQVRDGRVDVPRLGRTVPRYWLTIVGFSVLFAAILIAIALPLSIVTAVAQMAAPAVSAFLAVFVVIALWLLMLWCFLYLFFFTDAVVVSEVGPVRAALNSIRVVSTYFWSTLAFIIITWVIMSGMGVIWGSLSRAPVGIVVAIFGNGYIESGLAAAGMLFYRNRMARIGEARRAT
jgi:hypothetical protein